MGDGTYSEMTVTQSDSVISALIEWVSCAYAAVLVLSQFGQQLLSHGRGCSSLGGQFWDVPLGVPEVQPRLCFFHLFKESVSYLISVINIVLLRKQTLTFC